MAKEMINLMVYWEKQTIKSIMKKEPLIRILIRKISVVILVISNQLLFSIINQVYSQENYKNFIIEDIPFEIYINNEDSIIDISNDKILIRRETSSKITILSNEITNFYITLKNQRTDSISKFYFFGISQPGINLFLNEDLNYGFCSIDEFIEDCKISDFEAKFSIEDDYSTFKILTIEFVIGKKHFYSRDSKAPIELIKYLNKKHVTTKIEIIALVKNTYNGKLLNLVRTIKLQK